MSTNINGVSTPNYQNLPPMGEDAQVKQQIFTATITSEKKVVMAPNDVMTTGGGQFSKQKVPASMMKTMPGDISSQGGMDVDAKYFPDFKAASLAIKDQNNSAACDHFSKAITNMVKDGMPVDVNALVQQVLRESYMDTTEDLRFYADKVKYFNEAKKMTREYVQSLRDFKTGLSTYMKDNGFCLSSPPSDKTELAKFNELVAGYCADQRSGNNIGGGAAAYDSYKAAVAEAEAAACSGPGGVTCTTSNGWTTITDQDGYKIRTNVPAGDVVQIYGPNGEEIAQIWGDPHVSEGAMKNSSSWHFGEDSTFVLPNGTKVRINTEESSAGSNVFYSKGVDVLSGNQHAAVGNDPDTNAPRSASVTNDRIDWDKSHAAFGGESGGVFALASGSKKDWARMASDGTFHDIEYVDFDKFKKEGFKVNSAAVAVSEAALVGATSGTKLAQAASSIPFSNNTYPDTDNGRLASDIGLPNTIPPMDCNSVEELDNAITKFEEKLSTIGDDAQLANTDLQNILQKQQQTLQMMSNISKMLSDTALAVIRKIG